MSFSDSPEFRKLLDLVNVSDFNGAKALCDEIGQSPLGLFLSSELLIRIGHPDHALDYARRSAKDVPEEPAVAAHLAKCHLYINDHAAALDAAAKALELGPTSAYDLDTLANVYSRTGRQPQALAIFEQAVDLEPDNPDLLYNLATSYRFLGHTDKAEETFSRVIALNPNDAEAVLGRSLLKVQTGTSNHIEQLESRLRGGSMGDDCRTHYLYSLAKELEDLGRHEDSFTRLKAGADLKSRSLAWYDIRQDLENFRNLRELFTPENIDPLQAGPDDKSPVFVLGLPRSGTTLVERILESHRSVSSGGEMMLLPTLINNMLLKNSGPGQPAMHSLQIDFTELGNAYLQAARVQVGSAPRFVDKLPLNFLNIGYIRQALPGAKIVLLARDPMDSCYAMYKSLFTQGTYPFSYHLEWLGQYYLGFQELMSHFQGNLTDPPYIISYEALVSDPEPEIRALLDYCELDWDENCLAFHASEAASTTLSASQVREPAHTRSVGLWKRYEKQLEPLSKVLNATS